MLALRKTVPFVLAIAAFGAGWLAKSNAQQNSSAPFITYFGHEKVDATFVKALAGNGSQDLFGRKDRQGKLYTVHANSRGKADEGVTHSHEDWTGVVVIMSGAATFNTPGTPAKNKPAADQYGGQPIGGGESHKVVQGDVVIIPPNAPHFYKDIQEPFRYLVIQTP